MTIASPASPGMLTPMTWRRTTPLHRLLGPRSLRFPYPKGASLPLSASPANINLRFEAINAIDRIIGFHLSIQQTATASNFYMIENNTGWQFSYSYAGGKGVYILGNVETLPDEINLTWSFDTQLPSNVFLSFANVEYMPMVIT